ncbi:hypothetical protein SEA_YOSIF_44 [Streptomyces phage Yosif]|uniref:Uncharacterized protein n=1 Tax=Streptomyces phage Yosif TaxID=2201421 RepID=A0A2Z4QCC0_9CAUD|nr:hypothetical protein KGG71_gp44 [Streptomyces phage Yosif]AWY07608.1 hypothetical protein SEA_YOSIF_44 [Streptomyces phage Yosif]
MNLPVPQDPFSEIKKMASLLGDLRKELIAEGFTPEEAFEIISMGLQRQAGGGY